MTTSDDRLYFAKRAEQERKQASECLDSAVVQIHLTLADEYERRSTASRPHHEPVIRMRM